MRSETCCVLPSTIQTAGRSPAAVRAVAGSSMPLATCICVWPVTRGLRRRLACHAEKPAQTYRSACPGGAKRPHL